MRAMGGQRFSARVTAGPRGHAVVPVPFDPDRVWGAKAARIAEVVDLLAAGVKQRPRP